MKRVIFVEPEIDDCEEIINIFNKCNPDSSFVNPHICLVFPFESELSISELEKIINNVFDKYSSFNIKLSGLSISYEEKNNFLFLNIIDEDNILKQMSNELYTTLGNNATLKGQYVPHITIGKSKSLDEIKQMHARAKSMLKLEYNATISSVCCKKIIRGLDENISLEDEILKNIDNNIKRI